MEAVSQTTVKQSATITVAAAAMAAGGQTTDAFCQTNGICTRSKDISI